MLLCNAALRQEISLQKLQHPNDVKERPLLYKMIFLTAEQMVENLTILLRVPEENESRAKDIIFPSEVQIIDVLKKNRKKNQIKQLQTLVSSFKNNQLP